MEKLIVEQQQYVPKVDFAPNGKLQMEGRSIPEDASALFDPLIEFVDRIDVEEVTFDINLDYFNTASSKKILDLLRHLDANQIIKKVLVNWHYEEGDEDSVEMAEIYEDFLPDIEFKYHQYAEAL